METREFLQRVRLSGNPLAHPESVVTCGQARFTVLTARLLRLEWSPTREFTDFATFAFPNRRTDAPPAFTVRQDGTWLSLDTGSLTLTYRVGSGAFTAENLAITFRVGGEARTWRPGQQDEENLGGTRRTLDLTGGAAPLEPGLVSRSGWAVFDDSAGVVFQTADGWVAARPQQSEIDWYFFGYGHDYADALAEYTLFGGAVPLIPRYVLGIWWSRFWSYSAADLSQLVTEFQDHDLPLDVLVVDMDWHLPGYWTGYTWNRDLFPDPEAFLAEMHARGLRVTLNLHPADGVHPQEAAYEALAAALGMDGATGAPIPFRIADRRFAEHYFKLLHHPLEEQGVDFWWIDWQQGESSEVAGLDPLLWLNHLHFADARRRGQRPLLFSRWGGLGNHRYPIGFSGDTFSGWPTLAAMPHFTATAANVGSGWWSHDIGGHFGAVEGELFTRWVQFGALSPCLRLHAAKDPLAERRPWAFSAPVLDATRKAFALRHALVPYLYTMARHTYERGAVLCRPMYYAYPEDESAYLARGQYQLGDDLLAAPITEPADPQTGLATKDVWIPPGTWYRFESGEAFSGPRWVRITGDLETILLFARAGAIVPLAKAAPHLADLPDDRLDIRVFPGDGAFRLYEDDGVSEAYQGDEHEWTPFTHESAGPSRQALRIGPIEGHCVALPASRAYTVTFVGMDAPARVVDGNGEPLPWTFDPDARAVRVDVAMRPKREPVEVIVQGQADTREEWPAHASAGGTLPFAHVLAFTASDEAQRNLGDLILVPPYGPDGQVRSCDAEILWRNVSHAGVAEVRQLMLAMAAESVVTAPFALDPTMQPQHWDVDVRFWVGEQDVRTTSSGPYISPAVQQWAVHYAQREGWSVFKAGATTHPTITEPFDVHLDLAGGPAEARVTIELAEATTVCFDTWTNGRLSLAIDGKPLDIGEPRLQVAGLARPWPVTRFGPVTLAAGKHDVVAHLAAPAEPPWVFGVLLVDQFGAPLVRCAQIVEDTEQRE